MALPGYHDGAVFLPYHHRLVPGSVARSGDHEHPGHDLGLAVQYFVTQPGRIDQVGKGVVDGPPGRLELSRLNRDGPASQLRVAAAMVEVEVAVDNQAHVLDADPRFSEGGLQGLAAGQIVSVDVGIGPHPGVEQDPAVGVIDQVSQARLDPGGAGTGLFGRPDEIAEVDPVDRGNPHRPSIAPAIPAARNQPGLHALLPTRRPAGGDRSPLERRWGWVGMPLDAFRTSSRTQP